MGLQSSLNWHRRKECATLNSGNDGKVYLCEAILIYSSIMVAFH